MSMTEPLTHKIRYSGGDYLIMHCDMRFGMGEHNLPIDADYPTCPVCREAADEARAERKRSQLEHNQVLYGGIYYPNDYKTPGADQTDEAIALQRG